MGPEANEGRPLPLPLLAAELDGREAEDACFFFVTPTTRTGGDLDFCGGFLVDLRRVSRATSFSRGVFIRRKPDQNFLWVWFSCAIVMKRLDNFSTSRRLIVAAGKTADAKTWWAVKSSRCGRKMSMSLCGRSHIDEGGKRRWFRVQSSMRTSSPLFDICNHFVFVAR